MLRGAVCSVCRGLRQRRRAAVGNTVAAWRIPYLNESHRPVFTGHTLLATKGEREITRILTSKLSPSYIEVRDISGGCGSMYEVWIDSEQLTGKRLIQQHRMVNEALGDDVIKSLHGLTIKIGNPKANG